MAFDVSIQIPGLADPFIIRNAYSEVSDDPALDEVKGGIARCLLIAIDYSKRVDKQSELVNADAKDLDAVKEFYNVVDDWRDTWTPPINTFQPDPNLFEALKAGLIPPGQVEARFTLDYVQSNGTHTLIDFPASPFGLPNTGGVDVGKQIKPLPENYPAGAEKNMIYVRPDGTMFMLDNTGSLREDQIVTGSIKFRMLDATMPTDKVIDSWLPPLQQQMDKLSQVSTTNMAVLQQLMAGYDKFSAYADGLNSIRMQTLSTQIRSISS